MKWVVRGSDLKRLALSAGMSLGSLGGAVGLSRSRLSQLARDINPGIRPENAKALAGALGCNIEDFASIEQDKAS